MDSWAAFVVICMDLGQLKLMKYCDTGWGKQQKIYLLLRHVSRKQSYIFNVATHIFNSQKVFITLKKAHAPWIVCIL